jgi:hypothetical protein
MNTQTENAETETTLPLAKVIPIGQRGVELHTLGDYYKFAQFVVAADMVPLGITNEAGVVIALQRGAEVGLLPMQSLQSIYVVNKQPSLFGDAPKAIVEYSGLIEKCREFTEGNYPQDDYKAVCIVKRRGRDERRSEFSISDAKTAQLWGKKSEKGHPSPWVLYPKRMLMWRARGYALRDEFPDVLKGFPIRELIDDEDDEARFARAREAKVVEPNFGEAKNESKTPAAPGPGTVEEKKATVKTPSGAGDLFPSPKRDSPREPLPKKSEPAKVEPSGESPFPEPGPPVGKLKYLTEIKSRLIEAKRTEAELMPVLIEQAGMAQPGQTLEEVSESDLRYLLEKRNWNSALETMAKND